MFFLFLKMVLLSNMENRDKILRVIDANLNRSREGIRVIEDTARFYLDNEKISKELKNIRHLITGLAESVFNNVQFRLLDRDRNVVFDSKDHEYTDSWDFSSTTTQQLIVEVTIPENEGITENILSGCVSILVGFMSK